MGPFLDLESKVRYFPLITSPKRVSASMCEAMEGIVDEKRCGV